MERNNLMSELESNVHAPDKNIQKFQETRLQNLKLLKAQIAALKTKQGVCSQYLHQQQCSDGGDKMKSEEVDMEDKPQELQMWRQTTGLKDFFQEFMPRNLLYSR